SRPLYGSSQAPRYLLASLTPLHASLLREFPRARVAQRKQVRSRPLAVRLVTAESTLGFYKTESANSTATGGMAVTCRLQVALGLKKRGQSGASKAENCEISPHG